jgi:rSAM/selenodomain-associated transferase 2
MRISIIIPCWRELPAARSFAERWTDTPDTEVIFGLTRDARDLAAFLKIGGVRVSVSERAGRGTQMNDAARLATGDVLLFHHIDSHLTSEHLATLRRSMEDGRRVGGAFYRKFDERHPCLRCLEPLERLHCRAFGTLYGDQSVFVRRTVFEALGGYADFPIMEDVEFSRRLRRAGPIALLDPPMETSPRRHLERGPWRTTLTNAMLLALYRLGVPPTTLHRWYYSNPKPNRLPPEPAHHLAGGQTEP